MSSIQDRLNVMRSGSASGAGSAADSHAPQTSSVQDRLTKMRASGQPASKTAVPITTDLSGEAWTRATPSQTKVPSTAVSRQSDISRLQEQRRQAQVDLDTDAVARIDKQLELLRSEDGTGFSAGKLAYGTIQQGADRAVTGIVRTAAQYVEKPLMTAVGAVLGDPEMPDRAPLRKLSGWMDSRAEQRQAEYQENADKGGKAAQTINKWGTATAAALPAAIMAVMSGGTSAGAQAISTVEKAGGLASTVKNVVGTMAKDPQYWMSFAQVAGDSYDQAKADGAGDTAANLYGLANGLLNAAVEVGGGIQTLPSELQKGGSALRSWIKSMVDEGKEEVVQGAIERGLQNLTYQKGNPLASVTDQNAVLNPRTALEEFKGGAVVSSILGGGQVLAGKALSSAQSHQNGTLNAAGERTAQSEGNSMGAAQSGAQAVSGGIMEQEVQRLFGQQKAASAGETANSGKSVTLDDLLFGGKRVDQSTLTPEQFDAAAAANEQGTVGMDADNKVYQVDPEQHIDRRTADSVGSRNMNAFQFDHPELHEYYQWAANALIADAELSLQFPVTRRYERTMQGNKVKQSVQASEHLRMAMDETGLSRAELIDAAQRIVEDHGQENVKAAKQVEIILDSMLTNGWSTMAGDTVGPNQAYIDAKNAIAGSQPAVHGEELPMMDDGLGAADAGSLNSDYDRLQAQSDTFHPEGAYAARPVDVPTTDFDGRNVPKSASTVMGAQGTDAATVQILEQQIADGKLSFDTIHDTDAVAWAQAAMREKGFDGALEQYRQAVQSNTATKDNTALGQQLLLQAMRDGNVAAASELLALYTRNSTTAAQAMQAQSIFRKLSPEGQLLAVQKAVSDLNAKYGTDVQLDEGDVADFLDAGSDEVRQEVTQRIVEKAAQSVPGTFRAKYDTLRYLAMLGNPRTHIRNILGNTLFQAPATVKNRVGAVVEAAASAVSGGKVERTKSIFGTNPFGKLAAECRSDWANVKDFLGQSSKYMEGQTSLFSIEQEADAFSNDNLLGRGINKAADFNSRALEAEDTAAKKWIYTQSLAGYLKANGCKSISDADPALLNRARSYAAEEALRNTFNDKNAASDAVSRLGGAIRSDNPFVKVGGYVVEGVMPFKRTPTNIAVRAVEYSPIGAVLGAVETVRGAKSGDMAQVSKGLDRVAAGVSGTALLAAGFLAAGAGYVTGGADEDEKQQGFNDLTGHQSYAFEGKNGTSVTLDWLAPEAIPFFVGVELYNQGLDGGVSFDELWSAVKNASAPMLEMSMLQGLNDTFENAAYAKNQGGSVLGSVIASALTNYATQIFPTIGGQLERSGETERMTTYTDKNSSIPSDLQYTIGKVSQKIPGWDYQQIPYIDAWGRTEESGDVLVRSINNLFNPAYISQVDVDTVEQELQRLKDATGDGGVFPERAARYFTVNGERKDLTAEEYQKYAKALGNSSYQLVKEGTASAAYKAMSDGEKASYIDRLYKYADQTAKASVSAYQVETWVKNAKAAQQDIGVSPAEYMALYEKYGSRIMSGDGYEKTKQAVAAGLSVDEYVQMKRGADLNGNGSVTKDEAEKALSGVKNRVDLWDLICTTSAKNPYQ